MFENTRQLRAVKLNINWRGTEYTFFRYTTNEYKEKVAPDSPIAVIKGFFYDGSAEHQSLTFTDAGLMPVLTVPYIIAEWEDCKELSQGDFVVINDQEYRINTVNNVQERNYLGIISLEVHNGG